jgi:hypothetical protein
MSAQTCPTCGARPGMKCRSANALLERPHAARVATEHGDWIHIYDSLYRDKTLQFRCRPYANTPSRAKCGYKGVCWKPRQRKWAAAITRDGRRLHLGYFTSPELAHAVYMTEARKLFGEFASA